MKETWLVTGGSVGLGRSIAEAALADGHDVVVSARCAGAPTARSVAMKSIHVGLVAAVMVSTAAPRTSPYSKATRGNIDVVINIV